MPSTLYTGYQTNKTAEALQNLLNQAGATTQTSNKAFYSTAPPPAPAPAPAPAPVPLPNQQEMQQQGAAPVPGTNTADYAKFVDEIVSKLAPQSQIIGAPGPPPDVSTEPVNPGTLQEYIAAQGGMNLPLNVPANVQDAYKEATYWYNQGLKNFGPDKAALNFKLQLDKYNVPEEFRTKNPQEWSALNQQITQNKQQLTSGYEQQKSLYDTYQTQINDYNAQKTAYEQQQARVAEQNNQMTQSPEYQQMQEATQAQKDLVAQQQQQMQQMTSQYEQLRQDYENRDTELTQYLEGMGETERRALEKQRAQLKAGAKEDLMKRGLTSTSALDAAMRGVDLASNESLGAMEERLRKQKLDYRSQFSGETLAAQQQALQASQAMSQFGFQAGTTVPQTMAQLAQMLSEQRIAKEGQQTSMIGAALGAEASRFGSAQSAGASRYASLMGYKSDIASTEQKATEANMQAALGKYNTDVGAQQGYANMLNQINLAQIQGRNSVATAKASPGKTMADLLAGGYVKSPSITL